MKSCQLGCFLKKHIGSRSAVLTPCGIPPDALESMQNGPVDCSCTHFCRAKNAPFPFLPLGKAVKILYGSEYLERLENPYKAVKCKQHSTICQSWHENKPRYGQYDVETRINFI